MAAGGEGVPGRQPAADQRGQPTRQHHRPNQRPVVTRRTARSRPRGNPCRRGSPGSSSRRATASRGGYRGQVRGQEPRDLEHADRLPLRPEHLHRKFR